MGLVSVEMRESVAVVRLNNGVTNAISVQMPAELSRALDLAQAEAGAVVLAGGAKFFSMGFDLPNLLKMDRSGVEAFLESYNQVLLKIYELPRPTAAAIAGHAPAGGAILTLPCDYRFMASGKTIIGLNEILIGLSVPYLAASILRRLVGDRTADRMCGEGTFLNGEPAREIGLVDEVCSPEAVEERAVEKMARLAEFNPKAFAGNKVVRTAPVRRLYEEYGLAADQAWLDLFFDEQVRLLLAGAAEKF